MPLYNFDATIKDDDLGILIAEDVEVTVEVSARIHGGTLETDVLDVRCDGKSLFDGSPFTHALGQYIKAQALADLDSAGSLWSRVKEDCGLSYAEERGGWRKSA